MSSYKATGTIYKVFPSESKTDKLTVREFRIKIDGQHPQILKFQLMNERVDLVDPYTLGDAVTVDFEIRGREYGENDNCFINLNAWKIQRS